MSCRFCQSAHRSTAFTLVELMVAVAIFGFLSVTLSQFLASFLNMKFNAETRLRMRQEGNAALDRIDELVRNSITLPDLCSTVSNDNRQVCVSATTTDVNPIDLKVNTNYGANDYWHRQRVRYFPDRGELVIFSDYPTSPVACRHDTDDNPSCASYFDTSANGVSLISSRTTARASSTDAVGGGFRVENVEFCCTQDDFITTPVVTAKFTIRYERKNMGSRTGADAELVEEFTRETAVRNSATFEQ